MVILCRYNEIERSSGCDVRDECMSEQIRRQDAFDLLLNECPEAKSALDEQRKDYGDLPYMDIAVFARQLVKSFKEGKTESFPRIFAMIGRLITDGDEEVRGLAIVGLLEPLQNNASWTDFGPKVFVPWLGPKSLAAWHELNQIWDGKRNLADVVRLNHSSLRDEDHLPSVG